jgi:uracil-DNA glycosylase family 4
MIDKKYEMEKLNEHVMKVYDDYCMFGNGNLNPKYVFIGQNPGQGLKKTCIMDLEKDEIKTSFGLLFYILRNVGLMKKSYFTNLVKVKTKNNEIPNKNMTNFWLDFLKKELEILKINNDFKTISLGNFVYDTLKDNNIESIKLTHPSFYLRKRPANFDIYRSEIISKLLT